MWPDWEPGEWNGFCVRSCDPRANDSCLSHSFICMTRGGASVTFPTISLSESALEKGVDCLFPGGQSDSELQLFSQNASSMRRQLCLDTMWEGQ